MPVPSYSVLPSGHATAGLIWSCTAPSSLTTGVPSAIFRNEERRQLLARGKGDGVELRPAHRREIEENAVASVDGDLSREERVEVDRVVHIHAADLDAPEHGAVLAGSRGLGRGRGSVLVLSLMGECDGLRQRGGGDARRAKKLEGLPASQEVLEEIGCPKCRVVHGKWSFLGSWM